MKTISFEQIKTIITCLSVFIGVITTLITVLKRLISKILTPIDKKIENLQELSTTGRNKIEIELIKMNLVNFINDIEQGINKSPIQKQNAYELYDRYKTLGGNSYIHDRWEKLMKEGKL